MAKINTGEVMRKNLNANHIFYGLTHRDVACVGGVLELQCALQVGSHLEAADVDPPHSLGAAGVIQ